MKRAIIRRIETWPREVDVPDDWDEQRLLDEVTTTGSFDTVIDETTYDECDYDVEIRE